MRVGLVATLDYQHQQTPNQTDPINQLHRAHQTAVFRLRTHHAPLNAHLHRIKKEHPAKCVYCPDSDDTVISILVCAAASLYCACLVSVQVTAPYVISDTGSTQELYTCLLNIFYQHIVHVYRALGVLSATITFVFAMFILRYIRLLSSDSSCSICCSYCGVSVHRNMSSAKRRLEINYPSNFTPLFSQLNF